MGSAAAASLRKNAHLLVERMPEETLTTIVQLMQLYDEQEYQEDMTAHSAAFRRLEQLIRPIPDLDEKKELEEYWDEKYEEYLNLR